MRFDELSVGDRDRRQLLARQIGAPFGGDISTVEMDDLPPIR
jgi:hypothetical protein